MAEIGCQGGTVGAVFESCRRYRCWRPSGPGAGGCIATANTAVQSGQQVDPGIQEDECWCCCYCCCHATRTEGSVASIRSTIGSRRSRNGCHERCDCHVQSSLGSFVTTATTRTPTTRATRHVTRRWTLVGTRTAAASIATIGRKCHGSRTFAVGTSGSSVVVAATTTATTTGRGLVDATSNAIVVQFGIIVSLATATRLGWCRYDGSRIACQLVSPTSSSSPSSCGSTSPRCWESLERNTIILILGNRSGPSSTIGLATATARTRCTIVGPVDRFVATPGFQCRCHESPQLANQLRR
mmetsp:Transcript_4683/g.13113  ORF Transcript_4683/g.13113 Transcript_4683/m.13113 type:complete len:298 (+) Transcript_4683:711-1604(+)